MDSVKHTFVIAEAGVNHNGSLDLAKELIDVAKDCGADAVKFQTFQTELGMCQHAPKAEYQKKNTGVDESQFAMVKKLELSAEMHRVLYDYALKKNIEFLSTPFDLPSVDLLVHDLGVQRLKIASGEIVNAPLLLKAAKTGKEIILSTGMSTIGDIEKALSVLAYGYIGKNEKPTEEAFNEAYLSERGRILLREKVKLLHCTTEYPAPFADVNLLAMQTMRSVFGLPVGFSDHTPGISVPIAAVALGAEIIEKHFTLDKSLPGPDHLASLEPKELRAMIKAIREVELSLGSNMKVPAASEKKNIFIARKSLVAKCSIRKGEIFSEENIAIKRPGNGISPFSYWEIIGRRAGRDYLQDDLIEISSGE